MLPLAAQARLRTQLSEVKVSHTADLAAGHGRVMMPEALGEKLQGADQNWGWQWVFPLGNLGTDARTEIVRRHHLNENAVTACDLRKTQTTPVRVPCSRLCVSMVSGAEQEYAQ